MGSQSLAHKTPIKVSRLTAEVKEKEVLWFVSRTVHSCLEETRQGGRTEVLSCLCSPKSQVLCQRSDSPKLSEKSQPDSKIGDWCPLANTKLQCIVEYLHCTAQVSTLLFCTALKCTVLLLISTEQTLYWTALFCTILYLCTKLH